jgi:hypothetical protein
MMHLKRGSFSNASSDDFGNHKAPILSFRRIGQNPIPVKMFPLLIFAKCIGQKDRMGCGFNARGINLI